MRNTPPTKEQRKFARKALAYEGKVLLQDSLPLSLKTFDLSEGGIGALVDKPFPPGGGCVVALDVVVESRTRRINAWGEIVYCESQPAGFRVGIRYRDLDAMSQLFLRQLTSQG